jgi:hypothetical protein
VREAGARLGAMLMRWDYPLHDRGVSKGFESE